jgi:hypothetical protein
MSKAGAIAALLYLLAAVRLILLDARTSTGGSWISLKQMVPFLVTLPVSAPLAMLGFEPDLSNRATLGVLLAACAGLTYWVAERIASLFR